MCDDGVSYLDSRGMDALAPIKLIGQVVHRQENGTRPDANGFTGGKIYRQQDCIDLGIVTEVQANALFDLLV